MAKTYFIKILTLFAIWQCSYGLNNNLSSDYHQIPQKDGGFKIMNTKEIMDVSTIQRSIDPETDVSFYLNTRLNPTDALIYTWDNIDEIVNSTFNPAHPTRITIHGWMNSAEGLINTLIRDEYLKVGEFNVIAIDWERISLFEYDSAVAALPEVGQLIARVVDRLNELELIDVDELSIIGHSLGAHLSGFVGKNVKTGLVGTIVGLDPAGPLFTVENADGRIDKEDAAYVEIIHTNDFLAGFPFPIGDADFFPNGGITQGCPIFGCDHLIAFGFFAESISTTVGFWSSPCDNLDEIRLRQCTVIGPYVPMGGEPSNRGRAKGIYFLRTAGVPPFALGLTFP